MPWKKHFRTYQRSNNDHNPSNSRKNQVSNYQSWLPEVYGGAHNRIERYSQFDQMDIDSDINTALDTVAEFCTQFNSDTNLPFELRFTGQSTESQVKVLTQALNQWCRINEWDRRIFRTFRNTLKYGDQPFIRDPETWKLHYVSPANLLSVVVNEAEGKVPQQYTIKNVDLNLTTLTASQDSTPQTHQRPSTSGTSSTPGIDAYQKVRTGGVDTEHDIDASHVIHLSLSEGMDSNWPFGVSLLESIFKTFRQKELMEDAIIVHRVQHAPQRRVFRIHTGNLPAHRQWAYVERVKNEIHQKRIPNKTGGGSSVMDAQYDPLSMMEDYYFGVNSDGQGSSVDILPGTGSIGDIDDMRYFNNKMMRGLAIPSSYMPQGPEDGTAQYSDGRIGSAFIQEYRFTKYCQRLQATIAPVFNQEFKRFLKHRGYQIDSSSFELVFTTPQNFSEYRQISINTERAQLAGSMDGLEYMSKRFILKKYLGLTEAEINENEKLWREENPSRAASSDDEFESDLGSVGINDSGFDDAEDFETDESEEPDDTGTESPLSGDTEGEEGDDNEET